MPGQMNAPVASMEVTILHLHSPVRCQVLEFLPGWEAGILAVSLGTCYEAVGRWFVLFDHNLSWVVCVFLVF